jgi:hypothetical protein
MSTFLNINLDSKINSNFFFKHLLFSIFWIAGILIFIFRIDIAIMENYSESLTWLKISIPTIYFFLLIFYFFFIKWYYIVAFFLYPFLTIFWFIPKTVLSVGKIYMFGNYFNAIFSSLTNFKLFVFNIFFFTFSFIIFFTIGDIWTRWLAIVCLSYFFLVYIYKFLKKSFQQPTLFGEKIEESIRNFISTNSIENSLVIKSFIIQKEDEKLEELDRTEKQIRRTLLATYAIDLIKERLNSYRGRQAYLVSWFFGAIVFFIYSVIFFWFLNLQLYRINNLNFSYQGNFPSFDFLYYTLKTITFGDIELIKPISTIARISEITSFFTIGVFIMVIVISIFLSMKQDKVNENVKLTTEFFDCENLTLKTFLEVEFGKELKTAFGEIKNIDSSLKKLKDFIDKVF